MTGLVVVLDRNTQEAEFNTELEKGYADYLGGKGRSTEGVFSDIRKELNA